MSRSTWACELKLLYLYYSTWCHGHAPRERVSWNSNSFAEEYFITVTLHVSVWVEMIAVRMNFRTYKSRSTWACELKLLMLVNAN